MRDFGCPLRRVGNDWVVERGFAWLHAFTRPRTRYERRADIHLGLQLACGVICRRQLARSFWNDFSAEERGSPVSEPPGRAGQLHEENRRHLRPRVAESIFPAL